MRKTFSPARRAFLCFAAATSAPQNPGYDAAIVSPATPQAPAVATGTSVPRRARGLAHHVGAVFRPVAPGSATALKIDSDRGLTVSTVVAGGAAAKAGIVRRAMCCFPSTVRRSIL